MTRKTPLLILFAATALAGCGEDHTIVAAGPDQGNTVASNTPVTLPPSITSSKIYRCADNDVVYVDWLSDGKSANIRTEKNGPPTQVTAANAGEAMTAAGGFSITGTADAASVRIAVPGQSEESCKA
jgi:hypothetical protein